MRATVLPHENQIRLLARAIVTTMAAAFVFLPGLSNRSYSEEPPSSDWLKVNTNGEPCEATLTDGTVLKLETYGHEFEGYDYRPPMRAEKAEVLVDYKRLHRDGVYGGEIHLDVKRKKIYWGDTPGGSHPSSIRRANLNGSNIETVVDRNPLRPSTFVLDSVANKIYWVNSGRTNGEGRSIQCANLDGSRAETVVQRIAVPSGIAVDPVDRKLFYFDDNNLICSGLDGADERRLLTDRAPGTLLIDHDAAKIYWTTNMHMIRRADSDGANIGDAVNVGEFHGHIKHVAIDHKQGKLYWTEENAGHIRRANLDGSQVEDIVVGISGPTGVDVDSERGHLYWIETFPDRGIPNVRVRRATVPPLLTPVKKRAPPLVTQVEPSKRRPGGMMTLTGDHFESLKKVAFVDDSTGKEVKARFTVSSEHALSVTVPQLSKGCRHPIIVLQSDSGVTVVIPRTARVAHRESIDRFHSEDECTFVVPPGAMLKTERGVAFAQNRGEVYSGPFGQNTFFLKNGAMSGAKKHPNNLIYFEPFALISEIDKPAKGDVLIPCPAIRASVIGSSITYEKME